MEANRVREPDTQLDEIDIHEWTKEQEVLLPKEFISREIDDENN